MGQDIHRDATNIQDRKLYNKHRAHIHIVHQVYHGLQRFGNTLFPKSNQIYALSFGFLSLEVRLNSLILGIKIGHIDDKILENEHVSKRSDKGRL